MEINNTRANLSAAAMQGAQLSALGNPDATTQAQNAKPLFDGGLKVTVAERNVLDDINRVENAEEPTRSDELSELVRKAFDFAPPDMPEFV